MGRDAVRVCRAQAGREGDRGRVDRVVQEEFGRLQGAALRCVRRDSEDVDREDPEIQAARNGEDGVMPVCHDQIKAALELYREHLPNWRLADSTIEAAGRELTTDQLCLQKVVLVDTLHSTGLRFAPGARERTARYLCENRKSLATEVTIDAIEKLARVVSG